MNNPDKSLGEFRPSNSAQFFEQLDRVNRAIQGSDDLEQTMKNVLEALLSIFGCDRASLVYPCDPDAKFWTVPAERTVAGYPGALKPGVELPMDAEVSKFMSQLVTSTKAMRFGTATSHVLPTEMSRRFHIRSALLVCLRPKAGDPWIFGLDQCAYERTWSPDDEKLFEEVAHRMTDSITSLLMHRRERKANAKFAEMVESMTDMFSAYDRQWRYIFMNERAARVVGIAREDVIGRVLWDIFPEQVGGPGYRQLCRVMEERIPVIYESHVSSRGVWLEVHAYPIPEGIAAYAHDISDRKRAEEALRKREQETLTLLENAPDPVARYDSQGRFSYVNPACQDILGIPVADLIGRTPLEIYPGDPGVQNFQEKLQEVLTSGKPLQFENKVVLANDIPTWHLVRMAPERDASKRVVSVLCITRDVTALKETQRIFRNLADNSPDLISRFDRESRFLYVNPALERTFSVSASNLLGKGPADFGKENSTLTDFYEKLRTVLTTGEQVEFEASGPPGSDRFYQLRMVAERDHLGRIASVLSVGRDITALKETERRFRTLAENSPDIISRFDREGRYLYVNKALQRIAGISSGEVLGKQFGETMVARGFLSEDWGSIRKTIQSVVATAAPAETECKLPFADGVHIFNVRLVPECDDLGNVVSVLHVGRDITQRRRAEQAALSRTAFFEAQVDSALDGILVVDSDGKKILQNQRMNQLWKFPQHIIENEDDSVQVEYAKTRTKNPARFAEKVAYLYANPDAITEDEVELIDGTILERSSSPVRDKAGKRYGRIWTFRDITARRKLEEQFRQAQKMDAIGHLAGGIAHDFNNLLAVIQMQSTILLAGPADADETTEGIHQILGASERAANLTRQLLTFSRRNVRAPRDLDLGMVAGGMTKMLKRLLGEGIEVETRIAPALPLINADAGMMEQVLMNLAVNARDAMRGTGRLIVALNTVDINEAYVQSRPQAKVGRSVCLAVTDTGCGIAPELMPRIFEPFFTTKELGKGTGLGLATVFGIVEQHRGWIEVSSEVGKGTTFQVFLPALPRTVEISAPSVADRPLRGGKETILLVEDDLAVRKLARAVLTKLGYTVVDADSAAAALRRWDSRVGPVDLLLTDMIMPGPMAGQQLAELLTSRQSALKVIYTSGYTSDATRSKISLDTAANFLPKPYDAGQLAAIVRRVLDEA